MTENLKISVFLVESLKSQQKLAKNVCHFTIQFRSKNLIYFTSYNSISIIKICSCNTPTNLIHFANFPTNRFLVSVRKNISVAPFLDTEKLHYRKKKCSRDVGGEKKLFERRRKLLSGGGLDNFFKVTHYLGFVNCFRNDSHINFLMQCVIMT